MKIIRPLGTKDVPMEKIPIGLYLVFWKGPDGQPQPEHVFGSYSHAAVGRHANGDLWFAPVDWITVPSTDWDLVSHLRVMGQF